MSRDERGNRTQEVVGSIPTISTIFISLKRRKQHRLRARGGIVHFW
jgi:hypothetical protein